MSDDETSAPPDEDNLVEVDFAAGLTGIAPAEIRNAERACRHRGVLVDAGRREVTCRGCNARIDPFDAILNAANDWDRWRRWLAAAQRDREKLLVQAGKIKRDVKNAKSRLAAARKGLALEPGEVAELEILREFFACYERRDFSRVKELGAEIGRRRPS